ncbi:cell division protein FtsQ/DivIB [Arsukibacterium sp.]|uniref:cell division protein FtsQ/DivIB n=1 Tax=Arsukibacterium sp. TaxID=1977258 RepID=UPI00299F02E1|nr:cell division protein FtsQ/DivIB [Arsukibacterium sp.]MDX1677675.1 FtsQ-type POTRA domain-containing protein [Arsukibacterium sp.]
MSLSQLFQRLADRQHSHHKPGFIAGLVFFVLALGMLSWGGLQVYGWIQSQQGAPIKQVRLYGNFQHIQQQLLQQQLQQEYVGNFFRVNVDQVQQFLQQQPWVYQAAVRKQWPDTLVVVVTEQQPVAIWNQQQLLNNKGELFIAPLNELIPALPKLHGPEGSEQDALTMFHHIQALLQLHQFSAEQLWLTERFSWRLQLQGGVALQLGRQDTMKRIQRFIELYPAMQQHREQELAEVDLRYDTGIAVRYANTEPKRKA